MELAPLIEWRKKQNLSRKQAAELFGIARSTYANYENGHKDITEVRAYLMNKKLGEFGEFIPTPSTKEPN